MFETRGDRPQWRTIYEHIAGMNPGDVIKYDELAGLLPDAPEGSIRGAFRRAVRECETENKRTFCNVRGIGYRMVAANEHGRLADTHYKRARRQLKTSKRKASSADRSQLNREERARIDLIELNLSRHVEMTNRRIDRIEEQARADRRRQSESNAAVIERVDQLTALLAKHGIGADPDAVSADRVPAGPRGAQ